MGDAELEGRTIGERRRRESLEVIEWTQWRLELEPGRPTSSSRSRAKETRQDAPFFGRDSCMQYSRRQGEEEISH